MRKFNGDKAMTCKECFHYEACKTMLESMGYIVDGEGEYASLVCNEFHAATDVVEVVRCKDCKNWEDGWLGYCTKCHAAMDYNAFCSYGERREENV